MNNELVPSACELELLALTIGSLTISISRGTAQPRAYEDSMSNLTITVTVDTRPVVAGERRRYSSCPPRTPGLAGRMKGHDGLGVGVAVNNKGRACGETTPSSEQATYILLKFLGRFLALQWLPRERFSELCQNVLNSLYSHISHQMGKQDCDITLLMNDALSHISHLPSLVLALV